MTQHQFLYLNKLVRGFKKFPGRHGKIGAGFTLIELLVVISIIGILAAMIVLSFTSSQRQARDTNRKSDLSQYRNSLESFANKSNGFYPAHTSVVGISTSTLCGSTELNLTTCILDPKDGISPYGYKYVSDGTSGATAIRYSLYGYLENTSNYWVVCSNGTTLVKSSVPALSDCP